MPQLSTPTIVSTKVSGSIITVSWDDTDPATNIENFTVSFVPKDASQQPPPPPANTKDGQTNTLDFTPPTGSPSANDLNKNFCATVVANPSAKAPSYTASSPGVQAGLQPYWDVNVALIIKMGDKKITLTKPSSSNGAAGGVYRLPASTDSPYTITPDDINKLVGTTVIPDSLFGKSMSGKDAPSLSISELAVDTDNKLFAMDVSVNLGISLFSGLSIDSLKFEVERTDGVHNLDAAAAVS